jgi:hypothetical protein
MCHLSKGGIVAKNFVAEWKKIKEAYEKETGKKKPSEKFLSAFDAISKKSGVTAAFKAYEDALKNFSRTFDIDEAKEAFKRLERGTETYRTLLWTASVNEKTIELRKSTKDMLVKLGNLVDDAKTEWKTIRIDPISSLREFADIMKTPAGERIADAAATQYCDEILDFLFLMVKKDYSIKTYKEYIAPKSKYELNISTELRAKFTEDNLKKAPWDALIHEALLIFKTNVIPAANQVIRTDLA